MLVVFGPHMLKPEPMKHMKRCVMALYLTAAVFSAMANGEVVKVEAVGIENYSRLEGSSGFAGSPVGFGGATQPAAMEYLKRDGFATVISLRLANEEGVDNDASRTAAQAAGLQYINLPFDTDKPDPATVEDFLAVVGNQANQPVYIHCGSATRAASLWMIGRVLNDGWEVEAASDEAKMIALKPPAAIAFATTYLASHGK